jgi:hypothetical protein
VRVRVWIGIGLALLSLAIVVPVQAGLIDVPATSNIFGAGLASVPPAPNGGTLPPGVAFTAGSVLYFTFNPVTGSVSFWAGGGSFGPEGEDGPGNSTGITGYGGNSVSGIGFDTRQMFLTGVFLGPSVGSAPSSIDYTTLASNAPTFSPLLGQVFFIGDGLGTGPVTQRFYVPDSSTRLFFGFADGVTGFGSLGSPVGPGQYNDNTGSISVTYDLISTPEPLSFLLVGAGIAALAFVRRRLA